MQVLTHTNDETRTHDPESLSQDNLSVGSPYIAKQHSAQQPDQEGETHIEKFDREPNNKRTIVRVAVFCSCLLLLLIGRMSIPSEVTYDPIDRLQDLFLSWNENVMNNPALRNALQIICSLFMDIMFLATGINWIIRGGSSRLIVTTVSFYIIRAMVQAVWVSPFPKEGTYWWFDPGFPSLVVPYGLGTDFFFSGHIGFVTICALEWRANGNKLITTLITIGGVYTAIILMLYRVHYSIDLFTGITFAHYMFIIVDNNKDFLDGNFIKVYYFFQRLVTRTFRSTKDPKDNEQQLYNNMNVMKSVVVAK